MKNDRSNMKRQSNQASFGQYASDTGFFRTILAGAVFLSILWEGNNAQSAEAAEQRAAGHTEYALSKNSPENITGVIIEMKTGKSGITNMEIRSSQDGLANHPGCIHSSEGKMVDVVVDPSVVYHPEQGVMVIMEKQLSPDVTKLSPGECVSISGDKLRQIAPSGDEDRIEISSPAKKLSRIERMEALKIRIEPILTAGKSSRPAGQIQPTRLPSTAFNVRQPA
ncbi:hypothetical protein [Leptospirillum ferrooxidans]|uniref:Uncharacterized protein n=1 Tax=Leptospirillum ferrooxidans (strain C2-3) TaxID=1162668 RepID=I0IQP8_LEPFC|nr:hypothetical protein [Leptospirillum ferrooxidans]BAM07597.1 hypothetical protein LFE_1919 [Leptospirillum ferrooxidans C2-3]